MRAAKILEKVDSAKFNSLIEAALANLLKTRLCGRVAVQPL